MTWAHPRISSLHCGDGRLKSTSNSLESVVSFDCVFSSTGRHRVSKNDCEYEEPARCHSKGDT